MSFKNVMSNIFGSPNPDGAQAPAPDPNAVVAAQPGNMNQAPHTGTVANATTAPNGVVPGNAVTTEGDEGDKLPLDQFKGIWEPNKDEDGNDITPEVTTSVPETIDPTKLQEVVSKADFSKAITPEDLAAIQAGGDGATAALSNALNSVSQQTLAQATLVSNKLIQDAITKVNDVHAANTAKLLKNHALTNSLNEVNPLFNHPSVKPVMDSVQAALTVKHPNASTQELTKMTQDWAVAMSKSFQAPAVEDTTQKPGDLSEAAETDWTGFENLG